MPTRAALLWKNPGDWCTEVDLDPPEQGVLLL
jgi:hypothetical protein